MIEAKTDGSLKARLEQVQVTLKRVQAEGERVVGRIRTDASEFFSKDRQKAVADLLAQAQKIRSDLQNRAERAIKDLEERGQRIVTALEKQAERGVKPIVRSLNIPTRNEFEKLKKQMMQLEKRLDEITSSKAA